MSRTPILLPLALVLASCADWPAPAASPSAAASLDPGRPLPVPLPEVVARVNGREIRIRQILPLARGVLSKMPEAERDHRKPEALRQALDDYVTRELLLQEALARGIAADSRELEQAYDQLRREHAAEEKWTTFLTEQAMDEASLKAELRVQHTITALVAREVDAWPVPEDEARAAYQANPRGFGPPGAEEPPPFEAVRAEVERAVRHHKAPEIHAALAARLRERARVELFL